MSNRFSFDGGDERSLQPHEEPPQPIPQYTSARGGYQVSSGFSYQPSPDIGSARTPSPLPQPPLHTSPPIDHPQFNNHPSINTQSSSVISPTSDYGRGPLRSLSEAQRSAPPAIGYVAPPLPMHNLHDQPPFQQHDYNSGYGDYESDPEDHYPQYNNYNENTHQAYPPSSYPHGQIYPPGPQTSSHSLALPLAVPSNRHSSTSSLDPFSDTYGTQYPRNNHNGDLGTIDPMEIEDDGDDGFAPPPKSRKSRGAPAIPAAGAAGVVGGIMGSRDASGNYGQLSGGEPEKSSWLKKQTTGSKRLKWTVAGLIIGVIVLAIVGGVIGAVISSKKNTSPSEAAVNGPDLTKDSAAIKALMNNPNLHKVFPGMDYTPFNVQYPDCLANPPAQNNVTMDVAVLSQLTNVIRLYGTDCNQTEMVLHALKQLDLQSSIKIWMGIWQDTNTTTNARQLSQMYSILDSAGADPFAGIIVGNEVLFRQDMTAAQLVDLIDNVRTNLTAKNIKLPLATSDLGTDWNSTVAAGVDVVMSNVHPFFGGVAVPQAAAWTWQFWQTNDVDITRGTDKKQVISEVGWPSTGGNYCTDEKGASVTCANAQAGAVASVANMNTFMSEFVCQSLQNGTDYFWFEAFDEPWKVIFDKPGASEETAWGLMDADRNIKPGLKIPDCGGQTAS